MAKKKPASRSKKKTPDKLKTTTFSVMALDPPPTVTNLIWIDTTHILVRSDGIVSLVFETAIADHGFRSEACRVAMTADQAKRVIDLLASQLDHYPIKTEG